MTGSRSGSSCADALSGWGAIGPHCPSAHTRRYRHAVVVTLDLAPYPASVPEARRFTVETLRGWGLEHLTTSAALLVTELVTNSVLHARTVMRVCLSRLENRVRVEVHDGSTVRPSVRAHAIDATTGRGLNLVAKLAHSWGVDVRDSGKSVWAELSAEAGSGWPDPLAAESDEGPGEGVARPDGEGRSRPGESPYDADAWLRRSA